MPEKGNNIIVLVTLQAEKGLKNGRESLKERPDNQRWNKVFKAEMDKIRTEGDKTEDKWKHKADNM